MRFLYVGIGIAVVLGLALLIWSTLRNRSAAGTESSHASNTSTPPGLSAVYLDLRTQALEYPPEQFDLKSDTGNPRVYGVVMDWDVGAGVVTFASFSSGDASMYTSSGGGIIGGAGRERVKESAAKFVRNAQGYLDKATKSDDISVVSGGRVKFLFLTTNGRYTAEEALVNFDNGSSPLLGLFEQANELITKLREVSEEMENEKR